MVSRSPFCGNLIPLVKKTANGPAPAEPTYIKTPQQAHANDIVSAAVVGGNLKAITDALRLYHADTDADILEEAKLIHAELLTKNDPETKRKAEAAAKKAKEDKNRAAPVTRDPLTGEIVVNAQKSVFHGMRGAASTHAVNQLPPVEGAPIPTGAYGGPPNAAGLIKDPLTGEMINPKIPRCRAYRKLVLTEQSRYNVHGQASGTVYADPGLRQVLVIAGSCCVMLA